MTRYYIEYKEGKDWICDHLETPTPTTLAGAADLLEYVKSEYGEYTEYRVTTSSAPYDKTDRVLNFIDDRNADAEVDARLDAEHERQERHGWEQV